ncbi:uncharacterized protein A4U43_C08F24900 [Asparagus officinalis]|uniref:nuclear transcription factor Y subunit C-4-like isoform X2 n=1 Tax=Asparagus officinalis TaxID=4686 RepID=UPI00098E8324|nr:nuclear transcription factor Y subunit C-4-like isoform X2 [Asparagus officinalis]ONK60996.1 uncharacterized protein A4U43_C08F24900 [Asparagus officinalis]
MNRIPMDQYGQPAMVLSFAEQLQYQIPIEQYYGQPAKVLSLAEQQQEMQLHAFWTKQMVEIEQLKEFKNYSLPLARIKKIMKADVDVNMIASEVPVVFARATEMFILELTIRAWNVAAGHKRRTMLRNDIAVAIAKTDIFDFLVDIAPVENTKTKEVNEPESVPYRPFPPQPENPAAGMVIVSMMEKPVDNFQWGNDNGFDFGDGSKNNGE